MTNRMLADLATMAANFEEVCSLFALTDEQIKSPECGKWLVDRIKQLQTAYIIRKETQAKVDFPSQNE